MSEVPTNHPRGFAAEARRALRAYGRKLYDRHRSRWFAMALDSTLEVPAPRFDAHLVVDAPARVLDFIRRLDIPGSCDPVEIRTMHERGQLLVGVEDRGTLVGFVKIGWGTVYVLDYRLDLVLPPSDCFVLETYLVPERRGLGAGPWLIRGTNLEMRQRGFARRIAHVRPDNIPMLRNATRVGYRPLGDIDFISVCGRKLLRPHPARLLASQGAAAPATADLTSTSTAPRAPHPAACACARESRLG
jgi:GNAT superfamily N-acetyltransferase